MVDAFPPQFAEAGPPGQLVQDPGGEHQLARRDHFSVFQGHLESAVGAGRFRGPPGPALHVGVRCELLAAYPQHLAGMHAVPGEEPVRGVRRGVAGLAAV